MRLTVVDRNYDEQGFPLVVDVYEVAVVTRETFAQLTEMASVRYADSAYAWLVSPWGAMPQHGLHNAWGQLARADLWRGPTKPIGG